MSAEEVKGLLIGEKLSHRDRHNRNKDHQMGMIPDIGETLKKINLSLNVTV